LYMFCSLKNNTGDDLNLPIIDTAALQGLQTRSTILIFQLSILLHCKGCKQGRKNKASST
jgi:hypothetical protein